MASQILKEAMDEVTLDAPWPPTSGDLTIETVKKVIPHQLVNFLAWTSGISSEPTAGLVQMTEDEERRVLSIAQDMLYLKTKGRTLMPNLQS